MTVNHNLEKVFRVHAIDAREINKVLTEQIVDVTITSPPYYNLKDYGHKMQIGYGQTYDDYLDDLKRVFKHVYDCTKDSGTLWVIIDSYRENNEVVPLPFDFSNRLKDIGWKLQDVIIWVKDRTVPWAHKGQMRNQFEYVLVFSKNDDYYFHIDKIRDCQILKKWWIRYPERYNPKGKAPNGLWHFDIPTQGSWGNGYIKHFCPLPEALIEQILRLTTKEGDVVLDPFSGSGAVPAKAHNMNRRYVGFELNPDYIKMFQEYLIKTGKKKRDQYSTDRQARLTQAKFEKLILNLRSLKYGRVFYAKLPHDQKKKIIKILASRSKDKVSKKNARCVVRYNVLVTSTMNLKKLKSEINNLIAQPPLSKFGIEPKFTFEDRLDEFLASVPNRPIYTYTDKNTHEYKNKITRSQLMQTGKSEILLSTFGISLDDQPSE